MKFSRITVRCAGLQMINNFASSRLSKITIIDLQVKKKNTHTHTERNVTFSFHFPWSDFRDSKVGLILTWPCPRSAQQPFHRVRSVLSALRKRQEILQRIGSDRKSSIRPRLPWRHAKAADLRLRHDKSAMATAVIKGMPTVPPLSTPGVWSWI